MTSRLKKKWAEQWSDSESSKPVKYHPIRMYLLIMLLMQFTFFYFADRPRIDPLEFAGYIAVLIPMMAAILTGFYYFVRIQLENETRW